MTQGALTNRQGKVSQGLYGLIACIWLLMIFTFSAPEDWKQGTYGTQAILPPQQIRLLKLAVRLMCAAALSFAVVSMCRKKNTGRLLALYLPALLFLGWILATVYWSPLRAVSLQQGVSFAIAILLAFVVSMVWRRAADTSMLLFHAVAVLLLISSLLLVLSLAFPQYGALTKQASGLFHSTTAGASASLAITLSLASVCAFRWNWSKWLIGPSLVIHGMVLVIAANRFSIVLTLLFAVLIVLFFLSGRELAMLAIIVASAGLSYLLVDPGLRLTDRAVEKIEEYTLQGQTRSQFRTVSGRSEMWKRMWQSYTDSPWIGHGYFVTSETGRIHVWDEWGNWTAHNMYLQVLVSTGVVGVVLFLSAMTAPFLLLFRSCRRRRRVFKRRDYRLPGLLILMGAWFVLWGILNSSIVGPTQPECIVFALIYGIAIAYCNVGWKPESTTGSLA